MVFSRQDLLRVRLADVADPMWELVLSVQMAQAPAVPPPLAGWRQQFGQRLAGAGRGRDAMSLLRVLVTPMGSFPDFLTPPGPMTDLDAGCEGVLCASRTLLTADLAAVFADRAAPTWVRSLASGDRDVMSEVVRAVRDGHDLLVGPHWAEVRNAVAANSAMRARQLAEHGVGALLANLPGVLSWDGRVLCTRYPEDRTVELNGRGMVLLPSYFCWGNPITWLAQELPPVLVYQALDHRVPSEPTVSNCLVALLGRTRAECLRILLTPRSTTELAEHLGTSIGTASKQAAVLRDTGLVTSDRRGATVLHSTTSLGVTLLTSGAAG
jgi:DNA-binding transcriptional ArsR family regulator